MTSPSSPVDQRALPSTRRLKLPSRSPGGLKSPPVDSSNLSVASHEPAEPPSASDNHDRDVMTHRHPISSSTTPTNVPHRPQNLPEHAQRAQFPDDMAEAQLEKPGSRSAPSSPADDALHLTLKTKTLARAQQALSADETSSSTTSSPVVATAVTSSQRQLNEYREKLARDLERRELTARGLSATMAEKARVSPIPEESTSSSPMPASALTTTSTESGNTIRGGMTPAAVANTPSYPFPRMASGGFVSLQNSHRPFTTLSPTRTPQYTQPFHFEPTGVHDMVLSGNSTPASNLTFHPSGIPPEPENLDFPNPNLYELSLMLAGEPGLDAWWGTVVQIMKDIYKAERVTLAVPADATDIENVPWGQKATYNEHSEDDLSLGYMARGSSAVRSNEPDASEGSTQADEASKPATPIRPGLMSRHSYTSYEDNKEKSHDRPTNLLRRPTQLSRSRSYFSTGRSFAEPSDSQAPLNKMTLDEHDAAEDQQPNIPSWEAPFTSPEQGQGRVLPVLQALDYEADPLIDHAGVMRVLDRGRIVALTRTYPYLSNNSPTDQHAKSKSSKASNTDSSKRVKRPRSESMSKLTNIFAGSTGRGKATNDKSKGPTFRLEEEVPRPPTPKYEEYEQALPSPWSQSPAPSPAVRAEPKENPFFTDAMVDEESFNPDSAPTDYTSMRPPEAIGVDNSWTVLHIPLTHVLLSKPANQFRLDNTVMQQKSHARNKDDSPAQREAQDSGLHASENVKKNKLAPIAILSVLSPLIPYPSNLRHSLEHLAPHLATTFSLCRHYTHLETELAGLQRRRPTTTGFGAVAPDGRPLDNAPYLLGADITRQQSFPGSMTSPSDYSAISKSATGSPSGTPGWDSGSLGFMMDRRQPTASPAAIVQSGESYFSSKQRAVSVRHEASQAAQKSRSASKESSPSDKKSSRPSSIRIQPDFSDNEDTIEKVTLAGEETASKAGPVNDGSGAVGNTSDESTAERSADRPSEAMKSEIAHSRHGHTLLHSYGADFASTFQSLPPSSSLISRPPLVPAPSRAGSIPTTAVDMPPPSDKLKGLMLDLLPAHVFVALPQTGEIVWVNSRYLSYRGQTVADLAVDPWGSIHADDREEYLKAWSHSLRTGEQFSRTVRIKRFDGAYRWFHARAVASKDKRGVIMQFLGSYMDIHDQHIAELKAARQEEIEVSEAKHRLLANLIPQIIFTATEDDGITFANEQWLSYTGQSFEDSLGLGFLDFVHPEDLAKCRIPTDHPPTPSGRKRYGMARKSYQESASSEATSASTVQPTKGLFSPEHNLRGMHQALSRNNSSSSDEVYELPTADLSELARKGVIKVTTDTNGRLSYTTEVRLRSKTGEYRWHLIRCVEIDTIDFGSGASSYFGSATDINDHKILETKLKEAMESKSRFLSNMSHEIRTPLIGISGMVSFLQDTTLNEEQRDYTNTIQTSANSLIMIINDILDLSKVDAGMMKLKFEWFHTRSLIEDVNELVSTMAIAKRLELNYLVEADVPAWVKGDKVRIRQVLLNVIGNAIKFTSEGEVFSRCKVYTGNSFRYGENEIVLEFAIVDTGRGFTKEEAELIFKPFSQIDGSSTRQHGGSGLGLVISRQLVELHGGKMEGTAVPGKGSTFTFTARFALPTPDDRPNLKDSLASPVASPAAQPSFDAAPQNTNIESTPDASRFSDATPAATAGGHELSFASPEVTSNGSSNPSLQSSRSHASHTTDKSSASSIHAGLARFSEAAKASGQDLSQMKLEMPSGRTSPGRTPTVEDSTRHQVQDEFRPRMYSILIICPQYHSREATSQHIKMTLPKDVPHQITALATVEEAQKFIGGDDPIKFTHIVLNLSSASTIVNVIDQITKSQKIEKTTILVLCDSVQRQAVTKLAAPGSEHEGMLAENLVTFIYKPVKPSRFAVIFDPNKMQDLSIDRNRSTAQQMVESQKASYQEIEKRMGNKGYKVLLVEDNPVNQKVLTKYLNKIGVQVDIAVDGVECTDMVLSMPHKHYSLILCDLHMPRKDGYQACREIRQWERSTRVSPLPIIALSANVMSDVQDKCVAAGFSDYVTKPVDFIDLSRAMAKFF